MSELNKTLPQNPFGVTVQYDLSHAMVEGKIRDKLIGLGWTPPNGQPAHRKWVGLNRKDLGKAYDSDQNPLPCAVDWPLFLEVYEYIEHLLKEKYNEQQF